MNQILQHAILIVMLLSASKMYSQSAKENKNINTGSINIAISPLTIVEYEPSVNLQLMYRFNDKYSAAIEAGWIIKPLDRNEETFTSLYKYTGWRFRPEIRFWKKAAYGNNPGNKYFAVQGLLKIAQDRLYYDAYRNTPSGLPYMEAVERNIHKTVLGLSCLIGKEADLFNSKKMYLDVFTGLGLRYKFFKDNIGTDFSKTDEGDFNNKNGIYPTAALGIRIGFRVK